MSDREISREITRRSEMISSRSYTFGSKQFKKKLERESATILLDHWM